MSQVSQAFTLLDGQKTGDALLDAVRQQVAALPPEAPRPGLTVVLVGDDPASQVYVNKKAKVAQSLGLNSQVLRFPADLSEADLLAELDRLDADPAVHAILVQMPLPKGINTQTVLHRVSPDKDVDGFHPVNLGRLLAGDLPPALPCTPAGMMALLEAYNLPVAGKHAVVLGRSTIVGKPIAQLLLNADATVTLCHSRTPDLAQFTRQADILVAAVGRPQMITAEMVKPGAVVLDVGINRLPPAEGESKGRLVGDVDFEGVSRVARAITPVPGGVGPMTIAQLMRNTWTLFQAAQKGTR